MTVWASVTGVSWGVFDVSVSVVLVAGLLVVWLVFVASSMSFECVAGSTVLDGVATSGVLLGVASCTAAALGGSWLPCDCVAAGVGGFAAGRLLAIGAFGLKAPPPGFLSMELILQC